MTPEWIELWRDIAGRTTGVPLDSPQGKRVLALLESGDIATQKQDMGMLRHVHNTLRKVLMDEPTRKR